MKRGRRASRKGPRPSPCLLLHWHLCGEVHGGAPTAVRGRLWQQLLIPLEIKRERTLYTGKEKWENQDIRRQCIWKETRVCNKVGWLKLCSDCAFAAREGARVLRMKWEQGPPEAHGVSMRWMMPNQHSYAGKGSSTEYSCCQSCAAAAPSAGTGKHCFNKLSCQKALFCQDKLFPAVHPGLLCCCSVWV